MFAVSMINQKYYLLPNLKWSLLAFLDYITFVDVVRDFIHLRENRKYIVRVSFRTNLLTERRLHSHLLVEMNRKYILFRIHKIKYSIGYNVGNKFGNNL